MLLDTINGHYYEVEGKIVPSPTTILDILAKPHLDKWKESLGYTATKKTEDACLVGSIVHDVLARVCNGEDIKLDRYYLYKGNEVFLTHEMLKAINSGVLWLNANVNLKDIVATEILLMHPNIAWAGTADLVVRIDGELWIIDFKTSQTMGDGIDLQTTAYAMLWNEIYPDDPVTRIGGLQCKKGYKQEKTAVALLKKYKLVPDHWNALMTIWNRKPKEPQFKYEGPRSFSLGV
tara:strand:+ start:1408 stop:2109 length:702 start_codon:yes stop_codon:yes gene_type:complete